jgi:hypothetical protein
MNKLDTWRDDMDTWRWGFINKMNTPLNIVSRKGYWMRRYYCTTKDMCDG